MVVDVVDGYGRVLHPGLVVVRVGLGAHPEQVRLEGRLAEDRVVPETTHQNIVGSLGNLKSYSKTTKALNLICSSAISIRLLDLCNPQEFTGELQSKAW